MSCGNKWRTRPRQSCQLLKEYRHGNAINIMARNCSRAAHAAPLNTAINAAELTRAPASPHRAQDGHEPLTFPRSGCPTLALALISLRGNETTATCRGCGGAAVEMEVLGSREGAGRCGCARLCTHVQGHRAKCKTRRVVALRPRRGDASAPAQPRWQLGMVLCGAQRGWGPPPSSTPGPLPIGITSPRMGSSIAFALRRAE